MSSYLAEFDLTDDDNDYPQIASTQDYTYAVENAIMSVNNESSGSLWNESSELSQVESNSQSVTQAYLSNIKKQQLEIGKRLKACNQKTAFDKSKEIRAASTKYNKSKVDIRVAIAAIQNEKKKLKSLSKNDKSYTHLSKLAVDYQKQLLKILRVQKALGKFIEGNQTSQNAQSKSVDKQPIDSTNQTINKIKHQLCSQSLFLKKPFANNSLPGASTSSNSQICFEDNKSPRKQEAVLFSPKTPTIEEVLPGAATTFLATNDVIPNDVSINQSEKDAKDLISTLKAKSLKSTNQSVKETEISPQMIDSEYPLKCDNSSREIIKSPEISFSKSKKSKREYNDTTNNRFIENKIGDTVLCEMINAGILNPGLHCLSIKYQGKHTYAHLLKNGFIEDETSGEVFSYPEEWVFNVRHMSFNRKTVWRLLKYHGFPMTNLMGKLKHTAPTNQNLMNSAGSNKKASPKYFSTSLSNAEKKSKLTMDIPKQLSRPTSCKQVNTPNNSVRSQMSNSSSLKFATPHFNIEKIRNNMQNIKSETVRSINAGLSSKFSTTTQVVGASVDPSSVKQVVSNASLQQKDYHNQKCVRSADISMNRKAETVSQKRENISEIRNTVTPSIVYSKQVIGNKCFKIQRSDSRDQSHTNIHVKDNKADVSETCSAHHMIKQPLITSVQVNEHVEVAEVSTSPKITSSNSIAISQSNVMEPKYVVLYHKDEFVLSDKILPVNFWQDEWKADSDFLQLVGF